jgi:predicted permease
MDTFWQEIRVSGRTLLKQPGFTAVAITVLALGIGANTAIFSLVDAVMLKSLPVANPDQLYRLGDNDNCCVVSGFQDNGFSIFSYPLYQRLRDDTPDLVELAAFEAQLTPLGVRRSSASIVAEPYGGEFVSGNYFTMFGVSASAGRALVTSDDRADAPLVAVMSHRTWSHHYGLDPSVIGATLTVNDQPVTVVGVAPPGFFGETLRSDPPDFWLPLSTEPTLRGKNSLLAAADQNWLYLIGRLAPFAQPARLQARVTAALQRWLVDRREIPAQYRDRITRQHIIVTTAGGGVALMRGRYADGLRVLALVSALVLLIACANIANLLLARSDQFQLAVRAALGATRARLIGQALTGGVMLALAGGAAGVAVAYAATRAILLLAFRGASYVPIDPGPSLLVLAFASLLSIITGVVFSAAPAWTTSKANPIHSLRGAGRSTASRSALPRQSLVVLQAGLSLVLLVTAGLLTKSLWRLEHQDFGFETQGRLMVKVSPSLAGYTLERLAGLYQQLEQRLAQLPGVLSASLSLYSPMEGNNWSSGISIEGRVSDAAHRDSVSWDRVGPHYFETIGTRLLRGRTIEEHDTPAARHVAVINQAFARKFFPADDPIGRHLGIGDASHSGDFEIVGIVEDAKYLRAREEAWPTFFVPLLQMGHYEDPSNISAQTRSAYIRDIELQVAGHPGNLESLVRRTLAEVDPDLTVLGVMSFDEQLGRNFNQQRLIARLTMLYALLAVILASVGMYGVAAYMVVRRTREIGLRMALGADRGRVVMMVVRGALWQVALGLMIGIPASLAAGRALSSQLYAMSGHDPLVLNAAALILIGSALLAALIPARRAASIEPMHALRIE